MKIYTKILSVLFVPLSLTMVTSAEERSYEDIKNVALNFMTTQETQTDFTIDETNKTSISNATTQKNYQIVNLKPKGWVLVSRDDIAKPILGYSKDGHLDTKSMPPAQKEWLLGLDNEIKAAKDENIDNSDFEDDWNKLTEVPEAFKEELINNSKYYQYSARPVVPDLYFRIISNTIVITWRNNSNNKSVLKFYVDNKYKGSTPVNRTRYTLRRLSRGTHTIKVVAYNRAGVSRPVSKRIRIR